MYYRADPHPLPVTAFKKRCVGWTQCKWQAFIPGYSLLLSSRQRWPLEWERLLYVHTWTPGCLCVYVYISVSSVCVCVCPAYLNGSICSGACSSAVSFRLDSISAIPLTFSTKRLQERTRALTQDTHTHSRCTHIHSAKSKHSFLPM